MKDNRDPRPWSEGFCFAEACLWVFVISALVGAVWAMVHGKV